MYIGSEAFQTANEKDIQKQKVRGLIDSIPYTSANISAGSLTIINQSSDSSDTKIGAVYTGTLTATFLPNLSVTPRSWYGRRITVEFGLCVSENPDVYEWVPMGVYTVAEATVTDQGIAVKAYDDMSKLAGKLPDSYIVSGTVYSITDYICRRYGVPFGMTEAQCQALPNGTQTLGLYTPNDCETYRDIIYWLSVTVGGWATINRNGQLVYGTYMRDAFVDTTTDQYNRLQGANFSDFVTDFGSVLFINPDDTTSRVGSQGGGQEYIVGMNPFIQFGTRETRQELRHNIYLAVKNMSFMPFRLDQISAPVYDLGDVVYMEGGLAADREYIGCVQSVSWTLEKEITIQGFGADPNLKNASTAGQSASAAARKATAASEIVYKRYQNLSGFTVGSDPVKVVNIDFQTERETDIEIWHEIQLETTDGGSFSGMTVQAIYYLDGVEQARKPVETYTEDGLHLLDLHYEEFLENNGSHTWEVYLSCTSGTITIDTEGILAVLKGQGISKVESWTGVIVLEDTIGRYPITMEHRGFIDLVNVATHDNESLQITETVDPVEIKSETRPFVDMVNFVLNNVVFQLVSEDGDYNITSEDTVYNVTSEE